MPRKGRRPRQRAEEEEEAVAAKPQSMPSSKAAAAAREAGRARQGRSGGGLSEALGEGGEEGPTIRVNAGFASKFEKEEAVRHKNRRQAQVEAIARRELAAEGFSDSGGGSGSDEDSDDSDEDSDGDLLTADVDAKIHEVISAIRAKDSRIYDQGTKFFADGPITADPAKKRQKEKSMSAKQMVALAALEGEDGGSGDEEQQEARPKPYFQEQEEAKAALLGALGGGDGDGDEDLFALRSKSAEEQAREKAEMDQFEREQREKLKEAADKAYGGNESAEDKFLRDYVVNQWWKAKDKSALPTYKEIVGEDEPDQPDVSEDEDFLDNLDDFESKYNFRFEEEGSAQIVSYPRQVPDTLRRQDDARKQERERRKQAREEKKQKKIEEIKRVKNEQKKKIVEKLKEIERISGYAADGFEGLDLDADFDPDAHDRAMEGAFDDDYYEGEDVDLEAEARAIREAMREEGDLPGGKAEAAEEGATGEDDDGDDAGLETGGLVQGGPSLKPGRFLEDAKRKVKGAAKEAISKKLEELYELDFEDVIGGDIPCRFKYIDVPSRDLGMSVEEILYSDDKELNAKASLKLLAPYREDAGDNKPWWKRQNNYLNHKRRAQARAGAEGDDGPRQKKKNLGSRARKRLARRTETGGVAGDAAAAAAAAAPPAAAEDAPKKRKKHKKKGKAEAEAAPAADKPAEKKNLGSRARKRLARRAAAEAAASGGGGGGGDGDSQPAKRQRTA